MSSMIKTLLTLTLLCLLAGCQSPPRVNHVQRLLQHPQFPAAKASAPDWARDALHTINDLQRQIQSQAAQP